MLPGWATWARSQRHRRDAQGRRNLTRAQQKMCTGPDEPPLVWAYDRAEVAGVPFACETIQRNMKAKTCIAMIRSEGPSMRWVGFAMFFKWIPPWGSKCDALDVADVQWCARRGENADLFGDPQVSRSFMSDRRGGETCAWWKRLCHSICAWFRTCAVWTCGKFCSRKPLRRKL